MARKRNFGWIIWLIVLGGIAYGGYYGWQQWEKKNAAKSKPQFNTAKIERGDIVQQVTASGALNPVINVQVGSQISGLIKKLNVDFNSKVKAGDIVAEIDPATYQTRLLQAEADLSSAMASLQLAEVNAKRATSLFNEKLVSESEYDTAQVALTQAKAQVQTRKAQVNSAKVDLERCTIVAPIDGIVIDRKVDVGQTVAASMNAPLLFMIANDLTKMQINASVAEADIGNVETNQTVKFTVDAFPGRDFAGQVAQVRNSPISVQNVVTYDTIINVDNADGKLKPGMTANVQIITAKRPDVVRIPNAALRFKPPNAPAPATTKAGGTNAVAGATKAEDIPQTPEAMIAKVKDLRQKEEQMSDAMRAKMGEMMKSGAITPQQLGFGGGGPGGGGGRGGGKGKSRAAGDRPATRTIYVVDGSISSTNLTVADMKAVTVKTGIADSIYTEVIEGLKEGDTIVTGQTITTTAAGGAPAATNPFASGGSGFGGSSRGPR
ncbi:MAG: efflux transporter, family, subunit [Verrucomicrobia bacterium]|jgi:HlyD family secretion protein|nr:efflux transporter, family, subunit [Verrucomicrobiota bacterium]